MKQNDLDAIQIHIDTTEKISSGFKINFVLKSNNSNCDYNYYHNCILCSILNSLCSDLNCDVNLMYDKI